MSIRIIAEAGVNHNGRLDLAMRLALAAKQSGADIVKFQTFIPEALASAGADKAEYQKRETGAAESQLDMLRKLALSFDAFRQLKAYCDTIGIAFLSAAFDEQSAAFLHTLGMNLWKIPSGELTNLPLLRQIARYGQEIILSTGMSVMPEVQSAVSAIRALSDAPLTVLHCTTAYPTPFEQINLAAMDALAETLGLPVGFSDHSQGIAVPVAAAARGATIIEKHFTLNRGMDGPDHKASLEPDELKRMVTSVRQVEASLGEREKRPTGLELINMRAARKSIVAARDIAQGEPFTEQNLTTKRPGTGLSPMRWDEVLGQRAVCAFVKDELIHL